MGNTLILEQTQRILAALRHCQLLGLRVHAAMLHLLMFMGIPHLPKIIDFSIDYLRAGDYRDTYAQCQGGDKVAASPTWQLRPGKPSKPSLLPRRGRTTRSTSLEFATANGPARYL